MTHLAAPNTPFELLFTNEREEQPALPQPFLEVYPGDWHIPPLEDRVPNRPYIYTNFGMSRDGRISYNEPGIEEAVQVTLGDAHDRWLMALLRMRAEAFMIGDTTLKLEKYHFETSGNTCPWTAQFILPDNAEAFAQYREANGLQPHPLLVVLSLDGNVDFNHACFQGEDRPIILATTTKGSVKVAELGYPPNVEVRDLGEEVADLNRLTQLLYSDYSIRVLLCEGGANVFANLLDNGLVDEEFVTWCPTFVGRSRDHHRPSYTEGVAWMPDNRPYSKPWTLHRGGDSIFLRTRCEYKS